MLFTDSYNAAPSTKPTHLLSHPPARSTTQAALQASSRASPQVPFRVLISRRVWAWGSGVDVDVNVNVKSFKPATSGCIVFE